MRAKHAALLWHEDVMHGEVVRTRAAQAPDMPGVKPLGFTDRHEQVARLRLAIVQQPGMAILDDLGVRGHPGGMPAARAETLAARDSVPAWHHDRLSGRGRGVGHHAARRIDPDRARHLVWHPGRIGGKDAALVDHPGGAGVCFAEFLDHLNIRRQVESQGSPGSVAVRDETCPASARASKRGRGSSRVGLDLLSVGVDLGG